MIDAATRKRLLEIAEELREIAGKIPSGIIAARLMMAVKWVIFCANPQIKTLNAVPVQDHPTKKE